MAELPFSIISIINVRSLPAFRLGAEEGFRFKGLDQGGHKQVLRHTAVSARVL